MQETLKLCDKKHEYFAKEQQNFTLFIQISFTVIEPTRPCPIIFISLSIPTLLKKKSFWASWPIAPKHSALLSVKDKRRVDQTNFYDNNTV